MKKNNELFKYKNKIIFKNGASLNITSIKYLKKNQLKVDIFKKNEKKRTFKNL